MDTLLPDVSEHNSILNDIIISNWRRWSKWVSIRVCDGTYEDKHFSDNMNWIQRAIIKRWLIGYIVYVVYPPSENLANAPSTLSTFFAMIGERFRRRQVRMIDVERWGRWNHDISKELNWLWNNLWKDAFNTRPTWQRNTVGIKTFCQWLDKRRTIAYGNAGDLDLLWPRTKRPEGMRIVLADYTANPPYPGKIIHQYSSNYFVPGLGDVDINSADGLSPTA